MLDGPIQHLVKVSTFMGSIEVGSRSAVVFMPIVRDDPHIGVAHDFLAEHIGAVVLMDGNVRMDSEGDKPERTLPKCATTWS